MLQSKAKILTSGCGFSWSGQERKTWVNVLKASGITVTDVGGPAVSNQWIINRAFNTLLADTAYQHVVIQLTSIGKLDIEVNDERLANLVEPDSLRNFVVDGVWPSSVSNEHESKKMYYKWLYSPTLELDDLYVKLVLLHNWCKTHAVNLTVLQGYPLAWTDEQHSKLAEFVTFIDNPLYNQYQQSDYYSQHDYTDTNTVPCMQYQVHLAEQVSRMLDLGNLDKITKIKHLTN